ncbi:MAG: AsmA family protein [Alphaproteobacteria bacterium]|nr:AsmA family protein [Alphaproteobacteria bacterium]
MKLRKVLVVAGGVAALLVVTAIAVPFFIPVETYKAELIAQAEAKTGRKIRVDGPVSFRLLPNIALTLRDAGVGNPEWAKGGDLFAAKEIALGVELMPLFDRQVVITDITLKEPVISLIRQGGQANWEFPESAAKKEEGGQTAPGKPVIRSFSLQKLSVEKGSLSYRDGVSRTDVTDMSLNLSMPALDKQASMNGEIGWGGQKYSLKALLDTPQAVMDGKRFGLDLGVQASGVSVNWKGKAALQPALSGEGALKATVGSLARLGLKSEGVALPENLSLSGDTTLDARQLVLKKGTLVLDDQQLSAEAGVRFGEGVPHLTLAAWGKAFSLDPFLEKPENLTQKRALANAPARETKWSEEPLFDPAGLRKANAEIDLALDTLTYGEYKLSPLKLNAKLSGGVLRLQVPETGVFGGRASLNAVADAAGNVPSFSVGLKLADMQAEPLLTALAEFNRITGTLNGGVNADMRGNSQKDLVSSLSGDGRLVFTDGALKGVNLAAMARNVKSAFGAAVERDPNAKTDFSELSGSFQIRQGVVSNQDLVLRSPFLRLAGAGQVDLPAATVDYRLKPTLVTSMEGQGAQDAEAQKGIMVPIIVRGPFHKLSYTPDLAAMIQDRENIEKAVRDLKPVVKELKETVKDKEKLKEMLGGGLKNLLGGGKQQPAPVEAAPPSQPQAPAPVAN